MRAYNRDAFYRVVRSTLGNLTQSQVDGINALLAEAERRQVDGRWTAYILATCWHETARTMRPIEEIGHGAGKSYGPSGFYGRGYVQLTWEANYVKATTNLHTSGELKLTEDLAKTPDLAMRPDVALAILFSGMAEGWFTGKKLADYFGPSKSDWLDARRIVNGTDKASTIAGYAMTFAKALIPDAPPSVATRPTPSSATSIVTGAINPPAQPTRGPSPAPAGASAATSVQGNTMGNLLGSVASIISGVISKGTTVATVATAAPTIIEGAFKSIDEAERGFKALAELVADIKAGKWNEVPEDFTAILTEFRKIMINFGIDHDGLNAAATKLADMDSVATLKAKAA